MGLRHRLPSSFAQYNVPPLAEADKRPRAIIDQRVNLPKYPKSSPAPRKPFKHKLEWGGVMVLVLGVILLARHPMWAWSWIDVIKRSF
jgi:hypothetical protein